MSDLNSFTIGQLKSKLTELGVEFPPTTQRKQFYVKLLQKALSQETEKRTPTSYYSPLVSPRIQMSSNDYQMSGSAAARSPQTGASPSTNVFQDSKQMLLRKITGGAAAGNSATANTSAISSSSATSYPRASAKSGISMAASSLYARMTGGGAGVSTAGSVPTGGSQGSSSTSSSWQRKHISDPTQDFKPSKIMQSVGVLLNRQNTPGPETYAGNSGKKSRRDSFQGNSGLIGRRGSERRDSNEFSQQESTTSFQSMGSVTEPASGLRQRVDVGKKPEPSTTNSRRPVLSVAGKNKPVTEQDLDDLNLRKSILDGLEVTNQKSLIDRVIGNENICGVLLLICALFWIAYLQQTLTINYCNNGLSPESVPTEKFLYLFDLPPCETCPEHAWCAGGEMKCQYPFIKVGKSCAEDIEVEENALEMINYLEDLLGRKLGEKECSSDSVKTEFSPVEIKSLLKTQFAYMDKFQESIDKVDQKLASDPEEYSIRNIAPGTKDEVYVSLKTIKTLSCDLREILEEYLIIICIFSLVGLYTTYKVKSLLQGRRESLTAKNFYSDIKTELKLKVDNSTEHGLTENQIKEKLVSAHGVKFADRLWAKIEQLRKQDSHVTKFESLLQGRPVMQWQYNEQGGTRSLFS